MHSQPSSMIVVCVCYGHPVLASLVAGRTAPECWSLFGAPLGVRWWLLRLVGFGVTSDSHRYRISRFWNCSLLYQQLHINTNLIVATFSGYAMLTIYNTTLFKFANMEQLMIVCSSAMYYSPFPNFFLLQNVL